MWCYNLVTLTSNNFNRKNFKWTTSLNLGHNKNTVVYLPNHEDIVASSSQGNQIYREGEPLYSPFIRVLDDGKVMVYGAPWSGKTPCYKAEAYPLRAIVRLSQAPYNKIQRLNPIQAIGALLPSAPPVLNYTEETSDAVCNYISDVLAEVPAWAMECLPNIEAAELSHDTIL